MATTHARARSLRARLGAVLALAVAVTMAFFAFSPAANAGGNESHHRPKQIHGPNCENQVELEVGCAEDGRSEVWFTVESWRETVEGLVGNPHIDIAYQVRGPGPDASWVELPWQSTWRFDADNDFWFDDLLVLPLHGVDIRVRATATAQWADGKNGEKHLFSTWVTLPEECGCGEETTSTTVPETTSTTAPETTTTTTPETTTTTTPETTTTTAPKTTTTTPETTTTTAPETTTTVAVAGVTVTQNPSTSSAPKAVTVGSTLPKTGSNSVALVGMGLALITAGGLVIRSARVR